MVKQVIDQDKVFPVENTRETVGEELAHSTFINTTDWDNTYTVSPSWFRHRAQRPLVLLCSLVTIVLFASVLAGVAFGVLPVALSIICVAPLLWYAVRSMKYAYHCGHAVKADADQFSELWFSVENISRSLGIVTPDIMVTRNGHGITVVTSGHKKALVVSSDVVELGGKGRSPYAVEFLLWRKVGAIAAGHTSLWRAMLTSVGRIIPVLGPALSRSEEITQDAYGVAGCPAGADTALGYELVGKYAVSVVDVHDAADNRVKSGGWLSVLRLFSYRNPVLYRSFAFRSPETIQKFRIARRPEAQL